MARAIATLAEQTGESSAEELLANLMRAERRIGAPDILQALDTHFSESCGIAADSDGYAAGPGGRTGYGKLRQAAMALLQAMSKRERATLITTWLGEDDLGRRFHIDLLVTALFTDGRPLAERSLSNKDIRAAFPDILSVLQGAQDALASFVTTRINLRCRDLTTALYTYGHAFHQTYTALKARLGVLDYDDLIALTNRMLSRSDADWVAWKLERAIRHMLVDEAQDTSPAHGNCRAARVMPFLTVR